MIFWTTCITFCQHELAELVKQALWKQNCFWRGRTGSTVCEEMELSTQMAKRSVKHNPIK